ncbi:hypothetical protein EMPS_08501 [Entomortierella parvispora]|uniref:F-box domain-containing protein n=1 Tax=Entomortierella parvispora TaxID=205924 RepID=A0A9P3HH03_9FUNG|nr:hypothetical protein EMPS_08501 [Entomortierella parvispora]
MDEPSVHCTLLTIPSDIFKLILAHLSKHDLTVCIRVCRDLYERCIDLIWYSVCFSGNEQPLDPLKDAFKAAYGKNAVSGIQARKALGRNILRIRELRIASEDILDLFYFGPPVIQGQGSQDDPASMDAVMDDDNNDRNHEDNGTGEGGALEDLNLEVLGVSFGGERQRLIREYDGWAITSNPQRMRPILQLLERSKKLKRVVLGFARDSDRRYRKEDQARILQAIPPSVEALDFHGSGFHGSVFRDTTSWRRRQRDLLPSPWELSTSEHPTSNPSTLEPPQVLPHLKLLILGCLDLNTPAYKELLQRCPSIDELHVVGNRDHVYEDATLAELLSKKEGCSPGAGWKTLGFECISFGPLTIEAILEHCETLENFRLGEGCRFPSSALQKLLSSAPRLKRFNTIPAFASQKDLENCRLLARDIILQSKWVCLELQSFRWMIGEVPRPDPLSARAPGVFSEESRSVQKQVLAQLGRLTKLQEITLGYDIHSSKEQEGSLPAIFDFQQPQQLQLQLQQQRQQPTQGRVFQSRSSMGMGRQLSCLTLNLDDGLDQLEGLKDLRTLNLAGMDVRQGQRERDWMKANWPKLQKK